MPFTKYTFIPVPGLNTGYVQQIAIGNFISGDITQIYINKIDLSYLLILAKTGQFYDSKLI